MVPAGAEQEHHDPHDEEAFDTGRRKGIGTEGFRKPPTGIAKAPGAHMDHFRQDRVWLEFERHDSPFMTGFRWLGL